MDGAALLASVTANPDEHTAALVLADWLQENGAVALAASLRAAVALRQSPTVYLVTSGSYSDYGVRGVYSTRANAERAMGDERTRSRRDFNDVEEFELDQGVTRLDAGLTPFSVSMLRTGDDAVADVTAPVGTPEGDRGRLSDWHNGAAAPAFYVFVWARDERHAIKIANEKRIALLATGLDALRGA